MTSLSRGRLIPDAGVFFGTLALSWHLASVIELSRIWSPLYIILDSVVVSGLAACVYDWFFCGLRYDRFRKFFGLRRREDSLVLVLPAFLHNVDYDPHIDDERQPRYYKKVEGSRKELAGPHDYVTGLSTAEMVARIAVKVGTEMDQTINVIQDEQVRLREVGGAAVICFGSPKSNVLSEKILATSLPPEYKIEFSGDRLTGEKLGEREATETVDYGIIVRLIHSGKVAFVCAGIDEEATVAVASFLVSDWSGLYKRTGSREFIQLFEVQKATRAATKIAGFHRDAKLGWRAD